MNASSILFRRRQAGSILPALALALTACSQAPASTTAATPPQAVAETPAQPGDFCAPFTAMAQQSCTARYACSEPALAELKAAACGCRTGTVPAPAERDRLTGLLRQTRSFACCAGIAAARTGAGCS